MRGRLAAAALLAAGAAPAAAQDDGRLDIYGRGTTHAEAVYQALLGAGMEVGDLHRPRVQELLSSARSRAGTMRIPVSEVLPPGDWGGRME